MNIFCLPYGDSPDFDPMGRSLVSILVRLLILSVGLPFAYYPPFGLSAFIEYVLGITKKL